jgi:hypothetical protein
MKEIFNFLDIIEEKLNTNKKISTLKLSGDIVKIVSEVLSDRVIRLQTEVPMYIPEYDTATDVDKNVINEYVKMSLGSRMAEAITSSEHFNIDNQYDTEKETLTTTSVLIVFKNTVEPETPDKFKGLRLVDNDND